MVKNLTKNFKVGDNELTAVKNVSLDIQAGEFVSIMGPSGCGKSTFLNLIGGIEKPTHGSIKVSGKYIEAMSEDELALMRRKNVSFIYQFYSLIPELSVAENTMLPFLIAGEKYQKYKQRLAEVLDLVGLTDRVSHLPAQLSGGEQQRVAIARALIVKPKLLLADEPTGSLDTQQGRRVLEILKKSVDVEKQTIILVSHDPKIAAYADRIIYFRDGEVIDETSASAIEVEKISKELKRPSLS